MPKRIVDGDALWLSKKVKQLPEEYRLHYANWIPLAEANGVFEADPEYIHARVYGFLMPSIGVEKVKELLELMIQERLVAVWQHDGKTWGYFIGIEKSGRLPGRRESGWYKNLPPTPPRQVLNRASLGPK